MPASAAQPASTREAAVGGAHPPGGASEAVGAQGVHAGVQQPRSVPGALRHRIDGELGDDAVLAGLGVRVVALPERGETHLVVGHGDQHPELGGGRTIAACQDQVIAFERRRRST